MVRGFSLFVSTRHGSFDMKTFVDDIVFTDIDWYSRIDAAWRIQHHFRDNAALVAIPEGARAFLDQMIRPYLFDHLRLAQELHRVTCVHLWSYGDRCVGAREVINDKFPNLVVKLDRLTGSPRSLSPVKDLVLSDTDWRVRPLVQGFIQKRLGNQAGLMTWPGSVKSVLTPHTRQYVLNQLRIAHERDKVRVVHLVVNHLSAVSEEQCVRIEECKVAGRMIREELPEVRVQHYIVNTASVHAVDEDGALVPNCQPQCVLVGG